MGLKPHEVRKLNLKHFNLMLTGYVNAQNREWDRTRHVMSYIASFGGMGSKEFLKPQDIWPLPQDTEGIKKMIKTVEQAKKLLNEFE